MDSYSELISLIQNGNHVDADELFNRICDEDQDEYVVWNQVGIRAQEVENRSVAEYCFKRSIGIEPRYPNALSNLGNIMKEMGNHDEAIKLYNMAMEANPDYATAYHNLGVLYKELGMLDKSVPLLKKGIRLSGKMRPRKSHNGMPGNKSMNIRYLLLVLFLLWLVITIVRK